MEDTEWCSDQQKLYICNDGEHCLYDYGMGYCGRIDSGLDCKPVLIVVE